MSFAFIWIRLKCCNLLNTYHFNCKLMLLNILYFIVLFSMTQMLVTYIYLDKCVYLCVRAYVRVCVCMFVCIIDIWNIYICTFINTETIRLFCMFFIIYVYILDGLEQTTVIWLYSFKYLICDHVCILMVNIILVLCKYIVLHHLFALSVILESQLFYHEMSGNAKQSLNLQIDR